MFGFLKKQLKRGVEKLTKKIEEPEEVAPKEIKPPEPKPQGVLPQKKKPKRAKPELPPSEKPIEVREDEPSPVLVESGRAKPRKDLVAHERLAGSVGEEIAAEEREAGQPEFLPEPVEGAELAKCIEKEKRGFFGRLRGKITERTLSDDDIDDFFKESEPALLQNNVALEVSEFLKKELKQKLVEKPIKRSEAGQFITRAFEESIFDAVNQGSIDIEDKIKAAKKEGRPLVVAFLGFNGSGKSTSAAKLAKYLLKHKHGVVLAAGDTFRAASIEQLELHASKLGVDIVKHKYGADAAAVIFDAVQHAKSRGLDVVLADTAGRTHTDKNLMEELKKLVRVNRPDLKILVVDSLTGNDAVEQARRFNEAVGVDAVFMTKVDVNEKGGSILSVCYAIKKPIIFIGIGQGYDDIKLFDPKEFVKGLME